MDKNKLIGAIAAVVTIVIIIALVTSNNSSEIKENDAPVQNVADTQQSETEKAKAFDILKRDEDFDITKVPEENKEIAKNFRPAEEVLPEALSLEEENLFDPQTVERLVDEFGSYAELYRALGDAQRQELIDFLNLKNELRDNIGELLEIEQNSDNRAFMLVRVLPDNTYGDDDENLFDTVDRDLINILDRPTETPIGDSEWIARMHLAQLTDQEYAMEWVRDASIAHPDNPGVNFIASTMTMKIGASIEGVSSGERLEAQQFLQDTLLGDQANSIPPDSRTSAYYGLYWADDKQATLNFYRERLNYEDNENARNTLLGLITRIESRLGTTE